MARRSIQGFGVFEKTGTSTWTLTGTTTARSTPWTDHARARLSPSPISSDGNLGDTSNGGLTFNGGTLQLGASFNLAGTRAITLNTGGGTIDTQRVRTRTISQTSTGTAG